MYTQDPRGYFEKLYDAIYTMLTYEGRREYRMELAKSDEKRRIDQKIADAKRLEAEKVAPWSRDNYTPVPFNRPLQVFPPEYTPSERPLPVFTPEYKYPEYTNPTDSIADEDELDRSNDPFEGQSYYHHKKRRERALQNIVP
jgi:hypothetical protein